jgi:hypothetical protein
MCKGRGFIYLSYLTALVLAFVLVLAIPQSTALAKEPFTFPTSDNETSVTLPVIGCPGGIAIDNGIININHFGERDVYYDYWLYPPSYYNCFQEIPAMSYGAYVPKSLTSGTITNCYPLTGSPDTWYEAIVNLDLDGDITPDVAVHREIKVPSNESYFLARYTIVNIKGSSMANFRFFQGVDYDVASSSSNNEGGYDGKDFVWEHDLGIVGTYVGFKGDNHSAHHDVAYYSNMWNHIAAGTLNDASYYNGDTGVALEWDIGELPTGGSTVITVTFAFAPTFDDLSNIFEPAQQVTVSQPHSSPPSEIPPMRLKQSILSTNYARVTPQQTYANKPVTILTSVVNSGDETGNYNVVLKINGQTEQSKMVSVGPGGTYPVKFTVTKAQPGQYIATIDGHQADFIVLGDKTSTSPISGGLIALILAGILILTVAVVLAFSFRRSA